MILLSIKPVNRGFVRLMDLADHTLERGHVVYVKPKGAKPRWVLSMNGIYYRGNQPTTYGGTTVQHFGSLASATLFAGAVVQVLDPAEVSYWKDMHAILKRKLDARDAT